jgi:general secretion pathway protein G
MTRRATSRPGHRHIFFPWERRGGFRRWLRLGRLRPVLIVLGILGFVVLVGARERQSAGIRQTRATLITVRNAVDAYMADHDGACPSELAAVVDYAAFEQVPKDAWGRPLRLSCPGRHGDLRYELESDGPDGEPGGLDRIE